MDKATLDLIDHLITDIAAKPAHVLHGEAEKKFDRDTPGHRSITVTRLE